MKDFTAHGKGKQEEAQEYWQGVTGSSFKMFQLNSFPLLGQNFSKTVSFLFVQKVGPVLGAAGILGSLSKSTEVISTS